MAVMRWGEDHSGRFEGVERTTMAKVCGVLTLNVEVMQSSEEKWVYFAKFSFQLTHQQIIFVHISSHF